MRGLQRPVFLAPAALSTCHRATGRSTDARPQCRDGGDGGGRRRGRGNNGERESSYVNWFLRMLLRSVTYCSSSAGTPREWPGRVQTAGRHRPLILPLGLHADCALVSLHSAGDSSGPSGPSNGRVRSSMAICRCRPVNSDGVRAEISEPC
jgi:hypothetical protein